MHRRPPQFIYLDLGNVLLMFDHRVACQQLAELVGADASAIWDFLFTGGLQARYEQGGLTSQGIYEQFCQRFCGEPAGWPSYAAFHCANSDIFRLNVPIVPVVAHLAAAGHRLGILSNTCEEHWRHVGQGRFRILQVAFCQHVLSYEVGSSKPAPEIFAAAVAQAACEPGEVFFVDDRAENVAGACAAGLDAVQYHSPQQLAGELRMRGLRFNY